MSVEGERALNAQIDRKRRQLPDASFAFQTRRVGRAMSRYFNGHLRKMVALHATQIDVLAAVEALPNASLESLARRLGAAGCTVSRSLKRLEARGLVERRIPSAGNDRRRRIAALTKCGEAALRAAQESLERVPQTRIRARFGGEISCELRRRCEILARFVESQRSEEAYVEHCVPPRERWKYYWCWEGMTEAEAYAKWRAEGYTPPRPPTPKPDD